METSIGSDKAPLIACGSYSTRELTFLFIKPGCFNKNLNGQSRGKVSRRSNLGLGKKKEKETPGRCPEMSQTGTEEAGSGTPGMKKGKNP